MAITQNTYTGDGATVLFAFTFPYLDSADIKVSINGSNTTAYTLANATTIQFNVAPANGAAIRIYRITDDASLAASFFPGSSIRAQDLNENFTQGIYIAQEATRDVAAANAQVSSAVTAANTASANSSAAVSTANTAASNASAAVSTANTALSTANAASSSASSAVTTANSASAAASSATSTANTAASNASAAVSTANTAASNASSALSTANTASTNASNAVSTANTAASNASTALSTANTALSNSTSATTTANNADVKADAAIAAVASSVNYTGVANVASIPGSPANNTYIEVANSTGLESFTPLAGMPVGFVGDSGLRVRLRYTTTGATWNWIDYFPTDADGRYVAKTSISSSTSSTSTTNVANSAAVKTAKDAADSAQSTANAALPKAGGTMTGAITFDGGQTFPGVLPTAGGTMTGNITFNGGQTFPGAVTSVSGSAPISVTAGTTPTVSVSTASTSASGVVQLSDSTSSNDSTKAATSAAVKSVQDFAQVVSTTANAAMPKAGGLMTGELGIVAGTASAPGLYATGDTNTGIWSPAADTIAVSTGGVERLRSSNTEVVFNEGGADCDFRIEGDINPNLFVVDAGTDEVRVANINGGPLAGFRNAIINGNFDVWQRGTSFSNPTSSAYTADRWQVIWDGSGATRTISRQLFTVGQTDVPGNPTYWFRWAQSVAGTSGTFNVLAQGIEGVRTFAGQQVTVSFYAKATASVTLPSVGYWQDFGTGGSPSAAVYTSILTNVALTTSWQKITGTVTLPSISGKIIGSDVNDHLSLEWSLPLNTTFNIDIAQVQVEAGPVATPFERRPIGTELALCQRYFCKSYELATDPGTVTDTSSVLMIGFNSANNHSLPVQFPVTMRATPTITTYNPSTGASGGARRGSSNVTGAVRNPGQFQVMLGTDAGGSSDNSRLHFTASAEL